MKSFFKEAVGILAALIVVMGFCGCGASKVPVDYGNAEAFEAALNAGENLEGKVVQFTADEMHPDSISG